MNHTHKRPRKAFWLVAITLLVLVGLLLSHPFGDRHYQVVTKTTQMQGYDDRGHGFPPQQFARGDRHGSTVQTVIVQERGPHAGPFLLIAAAALALWFFWRRSRRTSRRPIYEMDYAAAAPIRTIDSLDEWEAKTRRQIKDIKED